MGLLSLADFGMQGAKTQQAVGHEWAHPQFYRQGQGMAVVGFGSLALQRLVPRRNVAEESQRLGLVATFLMFTGLRQRALGEDLRLL